jgi:hypothetical protein
MQPGIKDKFVSICIWVTANLSITHEIGEGGNRMSLSLEKFEEQINEMIDVRITSIGRAIRLIIPEYNQVIFKNPPLRNAHEGWAMLWQGMDQLWVEVKKDKELRSEELIRKEAILISATAMRFIIDLCLEEKTKNPVD